MGELVDQWEQPEVKLVLNRLPADRFKELKLLVERIKQER